MLLLLNPVSFELGRLLLGITGKRLEALLMYNLLGSDPSRLLNKPRVILNLIIICK